MSDVLDAAEVAARLMTDFGMTSTGIAKVDAFILQTQAEMDRRFRKQLKPREDPTHNKQGRLRRSTRMPKWASSHAIAAIYRECARMTRETGIPHHVDHIVPLVHPLVSGLHCEFNLRVITADENFRKRNRFEIE